MDAAAERAVEQGRGREQIGVAVALDDAVREAGDDRALRQDAAGDALEADLRFAGRQVDLPGLADQRDSRSASRDRARSPAPRFGIAIDGDGDRVRARPR